MLTVNLICIGTLKEKYWRDACAEYQKRLSRDCRFFITELSEARMPLNPSPAQIDAALREEGKRILSRAGASHIIAMCIEGEELTSERLSSYFEKTSVNGVSVLSFVIGGSWGLSQEVKQRAHMRLSMSRMTFPHQLARVMLCEQVYRAFQIAKDSPYHK